MSVHQAELRSGPAHRAVRGITLRSSVRRAKLRWASAAQAASLGARTELSPPLLLTLLFLSSSTMGKKKGETNKKGD